jgi:hypothetical protein
MGAIEVRWSRRVEAEGIKRAIQNRGANDEYVLGRRAMPRYRRPSQWRLSSYARGVCYILIHRELLTAAEQNALNSRFAQLQSSAQVRFVQIFGQVDVYDLTSR